MSRHVCICDATVRTGTSFSKDLLLDHCSRAVYGRWDPRRGVTGALRRELLQRIA